MKKILILALLLVAIPIGVSGALSFPDIQARIIGIQGSVPAGVPSAPSGYDEKGYVGTVLANIFDATQKIKGEFIQAFSSIWGITYQDNIPKWNGSKFLQGTLYDVSENIGVGTGIISAGLKLDVDGKVGAIGYCDEDGNNCFTASEVLGIIGSNTPVFSMGYVEGGVLKYDNNVESITRINSSTFGVTLTQAPTGDNAYIIIASTKEGNNSTIGITTKNTFTITARQTLSQTALDNFSFIVYDDKNTGNAFASGLYKGAFIMGDNVVNATPWNITMSQAPTGNTDYIVIPHVFNNNSYRIVKNDSISFRFIAYSSHWNAFAPSNYSFSVYDQREDDNTFAKGLYYTNSLQYGKNIQSVDDVAGGKKITLSQAPTGDNNYVVLVSAQDSSAQSKASIISPTEFLITGYTGNFGFVVFGD